MLKASLMKIFSPRSVVNSESNPENWRVIERRQWWLSATGILVSLSLTVGILSFVLPELIPGLELYSLDASVAVHALAGIILVFDLYVVFQQVQLYRVRKQISELTRTVPGVAHSVEFAGFAALDGTNRNNAVSVFLPLAPFEERVKDPRLNGFAIMAQVRRKVSQIQDARVLAFPPPPVRGIGNAGGFKIQIEDRRGAGLSALQAATDQLIAKASTGHGLVGLFTSFRSQVPQLYLDIDRRKVEILDVPILSLFNTLQAYLGSASRRVRS